MRDPHRVDGGRDGQAIGTLGVERARDGEKRPRQVLLSPIQRRLDHELVATQRAEADEVQHPCAAQDHAEGGEADCVCRSGEHRDDCAEDPRDLEPGLEPRERPALLGVGSKALREAVEQARLTLRSPQRPRRKPKRPVRQRGAQQVSVTVSIGVAGGGGRGTTPQGLLKTADKALYRAKRNGRNQVAR